MTNQNSENKTHETQQSLPFNHEPAAVTVNQDLLPIQIIEAGGPPKKVDYSTLPKPIRIFGYVVTVILLIFTLITIFAR